MKKTFLKYLKDQKVKNELLLTNSISEDDKAIIQATQENLQILIDEIESMETEDQTIITELKASLDSLEEQMTAIKEKINQNKNTEDKNIEEKEMENTFLKTNEAMKAFANSIRKAKNADEFRSNWNAVLVENGIVIEEGSEDAFIPTPVKGMIEDLWNKEAGWLKDLKDTKALAYNARFNKDDQDTLTARAKGHKKGDVKTAQTLNLAAKLIKGQFIYKIQEIDRETKFESDTALIEYVVKELFGQVLYEMKRAILVGDGREANDDNKVYSFETIKKETSDAFTTVTARGEGFLIDDIVKTVNTIKNESSKKVLAFMNTTTLTALRRVQASETASPVYMPIEQIAEMIGVNEIITTDLLNDEEVIAMIPDSYLLVGKNPLNPDMYEWHEGYKNLDVIRYESYVGGGIGTPLSTAVLA